MSHPVSVGGLVPLCYVSPFKNAALYVRARVYHQETNALLATKDLTHIEEGRYTDATFFMPNVPGIIVRYDIFTDVGYSTPSDDEGSVDERFSTSVTVPPDVIRNDEIELVFNDSDESIDLAFEEDDGFELVFTDDESLELVFEETEESLDLVFDDGEAFELTFLDCC